MIPCGSSGLKDRLNGNPRTGIQGTICSFLACIFPISAAIVVRSHPFPLPDTEAIQASLDNRRVNKPSIVSLYRWHCMGIHVGE